MRGKLYLVGTPIGNLGDVTFRALETLKNADVIACEDTRRTLPFLAGFEIKKPLISYYKHKEKEGTERIKELLNEGKNVALVTDAGMPCISDPGSVLVKELFVEGYAFEVVPGPTAVASAAALLGCENGFAFFGFLPEKKKEKKEVASEIKPLRRTALLYAAPHDVNDVLDFLYEELGDRDVALVKEITKIHENVKKGRLADLREENPRGEYVVAIEPAEKDQTTSEEEIKNRLEALISEGVDKKTAVKRVAEETGASKNVVYKLALDL